MKSLIAAAVGLSLITPCSLFANNEADVRATIQAFYKAFNEGFTGPVNFAADGWNHINPYGGRTNSLEATLKEVRPLHQTFLKGATDTIQTLDIRFASSDVAIGTVVSVLSPVTAPDGTRHSAQRQIRTFVIVKRDSRWRIMQDQNTLIPEPKR